MNQQTPQTKTAGTHDSREEEGRRMTTKSATARSSITDTHSRYKNIIDAEEEQKRKSAELSDDEQLSVSCRIAGSDHIPYIIRRAEMLEQLRMISDTTARMVRSLLIRAAEARKIPIEMFYESYLSLHVEFSIPQEKEGESDGKN